MTNKEYADILLPNVLHDTKYYEEMYPERNLKEGAMVTRFAPSPTGFVHMGSLYASFSALQLAKETGGICYLRIEDTDGKRTVENGVQGIIDDFKSLNISFDEGEGFGGKYGPYIQSQRKDIYQAYAKKLIEEDLAYPCFQTPEEIEEIREYQRRKKLRIGLYKKYAKDRDLTREQVLNKINNGEKYIICLKSPGNFENKVILDDVIKGTIEMPENDIDEVLIKSDGLPTYHFAHVIDDHLMHTTHVTRGDEWVSSYPIHEQLFKVLGFKMPRYGHIAPITIKEGETVRKLSKRKDKEAAISYYMELGIPTEAIRLYLATIENYDFEEWYSNNPTKSIDDFNFEFKKMPIGGTLFDIEKLMSISKIYFSRLKNTSLFEMLDKYTCTYDIEFNKIINENKEYTLNILNIEREIERPRKDIGSLSDVKKEFWYMFDYYFNTLNHDYEWQKINDLKDINLILNEYMNSYNDSDTQEEWFNKIKAICDKLGYASNMKEYKNNPDNFKGNVADVSCVLRVALTKSSRTPDLYQIMHILGSNKISERFALLNK
jgi:glutamyl-tRNA synthetase